MNSTGSRRRSILLASATFVCTAAAIFFGLLFYFLYGQYRGLFNEQGRYFDGITVHDEQSFVLIVPTLVFVVAAVVFGLIWRRAH